MHHRAYDLLYTAIQLRFDPDNATGKPDSLYKDLLSSAIMGIEFCIGLLNQRGANINKSDIAQLATASLRPGLTNGARIALNGPLNLDLEFFFKEWTRSHAQNVYRRFLETRGKTTTNSLTDDEFIEKYGPPPWELVDAQLQRLGIDARVQINKEAPEDPRQDIGELNLIDTKGNIFPPSGLSSGERILTKIALVRYIQSTDLIYYKKPKLILFDEPDAHLHPSLVEELFATIKEVFLDDGIKVILTTHSPTTVALADEGTIIALQRHAPPELISRRAAVNILMSGQEKAFVDISGTRLVFVEDASDASLLGRLMGLLSKHLTGVNFEFRSLSTKSAGSTRNGGKSLVKAAISQIGVGRNIVGLIDYDGDESAIPGIFTLCGSERYAIENLLLDPRIIVQMLLRADSAKWSELFDLDSVYTNSTPLTHEVLQRCIDRVHEIVFEKTAEDFREVHYLDGQVFKVGSEWLLHKGKVLRGKILDKLADLAQTPSKKDMLEHIVDQILLEQPGMIANSLIETFQALADAE